MKRADMLTLTDKVKLGTANFTIENIHLCRDGKVQLTLIYESMPADFVTLTLMPWDEIEVIGMHCWEPK